MLLLVNVSKVYHSQLIPAPADCSRTGNQKSIGPKEPCTGRCRYHNHHHCRSSLLLRRRCRFTLLCPEQARTIVALSAKAPRLSRTLDTSCHVPLLMHCWSQLCMSRRMRSYVSASWITSAGLHALLHCSCRTVPSLVRKSLTVRIESAILQDLLSRGQSLSARLA